MFIVTATEDTEMLSEGVVIGGSIKMLGGVVNPLPEDNRWFP
jgi:hypothetical protein